MAYTSWWKFGSSLVPTARMVPSSSWLASPACPPLKPRDQEPHRGLAACQHGQALGRPVQRRPIGANNEPQHCRIPSVQTIYRVSTERVHCQEAQQGSLICPRAVSGGILRSLPSLPTNPSQKLPPAPFDDAPRQAFGVRPSAELGRCPQSNARGASGRSLRQIVIAIPACQIQMR